MKNLAENEYILKGREKLESFSDLQESMRPGGERSGFELFLPKEKLPLTYCNF